MINKIKTLEEMHPVLERLLSEDKYYQALCFVQDYIIPNVLDLNLLGGSQEKQSLYYSVCNTFYLNQRYEEARDFMDKYFAGDICDYSIECVILRAMLYIRNTEYSHAREILMRKIIGECENGKYYQIQLILGLSYFYEGDYYKATDCFNACNKYANSVDDLYIRGCSLNMLGHIAFQRCYFDVAETYYTESLADFKASGKLHQIGNTYKLIGILYYRTGRYVEAKKNINLALKYFVRCSNQIEIVNSMIALGRIELFTDNYDNSKEIFKKTYKRSHELKFQREVALSAEFLGEALFKTGNYRRSLRYLKESAQYACRIAPRGDIAVEVYRRMGEVLLALNNMAAAERVLLKAIDISQELADKYELGAILRAMGLIALESQDVELTKSYFKESIITLKLIKESYELAHTYYVAAAAYRDIASSADMTIDNQGDLLADARNYAIEAMHLYSIQNLKAKTEACKLLIDSIERRMIRPTGSIQPALVEFNTAWLYESSVVGRSGNIDAAIQKARLVAPSDIPILVSGETGTGKELLASLLHNLSLRSGGPFIPVNCASIPETVFESEMFGHRKGAFTGALRDKPGMMEVANGGTLFLDEISELTNQQQAKLLRALQERKIRRVGETMERPIDVRIISASNSNIKALVESGALRKDFYYRICVETIELEPLRKRKEDILPLFIYYLDGNSNNIKVEDGVFELFDRYHWPGNVRELIGIVKILKLVSEESGIIRVCDLPLKLREISSSAHVHSWGRPKKRMTSTITGKISGGDEPLLRDLIISSLLKYRGNKSAVARDLGVSRSTLYRRMDELKIER